MLDKSPDELEFLFHIFSHTDQMEDKDLSFSYHILFVNDMTIPMCNDIPCSICEFSCKQGENRASVLTEYAKKYFPEMLI